MIKQLMPEQVRMLETHYREWRAVAARSGPADRNVVQNAIGKLYAASGHDWPSFVWCESPRELLTSLWPAPVPSQNLIHAKSNILACARPRPW